ncbi:ABC transporter ATP-binding protein [Pelagibius litoralis]|uniref:ABC transporter ATP-binding protein n=1 Tax=Pelagibius litoralis TaxID=374515 RepID=A0A967EWQ8_9PROT|nr:ABC transporter ATP-binding protein [Pelagibius litoralis]NIA67878.1 ABC transporter ATP-binding protein [Pelagibius litoralis]
MTARGQTNLLTVEGVSVSFDGLHGPVQVLDDINFTIGSGEIVGIVGESGSGKSVTSLAVMGLLGAQGKIDSGRIVLDGADLTALTHKEMRGVRGRDVAMIFQEPSTSLNPVLPVGFQIAEVLTEHFDTSAAEARKKAIALMDRVGIPAAGSRADDYPHQLSGGMKQRIMIAMALACRSKLLIADEPTTALDVTIQAQILSLISDLRNDYGMAVLLITHDMGVIAEMADRVIVMYAGQVVEQSPADSLFQHPLHPYTRLLLRSIPSARSKQAVLPMIEGTTPPPTDLPGGCRFHPRCPIAADLCRDGTPSLQTVGSNHAARCKRLDEDYSLLDAGLGVAL